MTEHTDPSQSLTQGAQQILDSAAAKQKEAGHDVLGLHHWLLALLERHGPMAEALADGLDAKALVRYMRTRILEKDAGEAMTAEGVAERALKRAVARGLDKAGERDVAAVVLEAAGYTIREREAAPRTTAPTIPGAATDRNAAPPIAPGKPSVGSRVRRPTPMLDDVGRDLTRDATEGKILPVVGREDAIQLMIETLCRRTKRNPVLVGPAGVGKTALVEGFALRVASGEVPDILQGARVVALQPSSVVAGAGVVGEMEKRMRTVLAEANQEGLILFIDEVHSIIGAGGRTGVGDMAQLLKPALARGDIACIAATTDEDYRRFMESDSALERRFQPIRVQEMTPHQTVEVLRIIRDSFATDRGVAVEDAVLEWLVDFGHEFLRNRHFPDKAVDLLEQCVAHAVANGQDEVSLSDAENVAQRMVGMPISPSGRIESLREGLTERALLPEAQAERLLRRLEVTIRGLDIRASGPNGVVLLMGNAASAGEALAEVIAEALFGAADRVVTLSLGRLTQPFDTSALIGAPPGYVGYSDTLPLHSLIQMPWCVLHCEGFDACHPHVREVIARGIRDGVITDALGKHIYLSDAVVVLSSSVEVGERTPVGFVPEEGNEEDDAPQRAARDVAAEVFGRELLDHIDVVCAAAPSTRDAGRRWIEKQLLAGLSERYRRHGIELHWDESLVEWLLEHQADRAGQHEWERLADERISPLLVPYLTPQEGKEVKTLVLTSEGGEVQIQVQHTEEE